MAVLLLTVVIATSGQSNGLSAVFGDPAARELMQIRRSFDEAELAAIREFDTAMGSAVARTAVPMEAYRTQRAPAGESKWSDEQKRRAASAWPRRQKKIDEAEKLLSTRTVAVLRRFGYKESRLPSIQRRKWDGPAAYVFTSPMPSESRVLLEELRRLWNLSGRRRN